MHREIFVAWLPWLALLLACFLLLRLLLKVGGNPWRWRRLLALHHDEDGAVQTLSFVLTVPVFIMVAMLIVQISQLMIAIVTVNYAAFAAARSAVVWIPADVGGDEGENRISVFAQGDADIPGRGTQYVIQPGGAKHEKIRLAAVMACVPISPSRNVGFPAQGEKIDALKKVYQALDPASYEENNRIPRRLENKLGYALANTEIEIGFLHKEDEPPTLRWDIPHNREEFYYNEVGWQDPIRVTVTHQLALLPGPGRLLARSTPREGGEDKVAASIDKRGQTFVREISASCTMGNEGEKPVLSFRHRLDGSGAPNSQPAVESGGFFGMTGSSDSSMSLGNESPDGGG